MEEYQKTDSVEIMSDKIEQKKCPWRNIKYMYQNYGLKYVRKWAI